MRWVRKPLVGGRDTEAAREWDENYHVLDHFPAGATPAVTGMYEDRPWFRPGQPHYDPSVLAFVKEFQWDRLGATRGAWDVVVRYAHELTEEENPLNEPAKITMDGESESVPILFDAEEKPLLTTAGEFVAGLEEVEERNVFHVTKNVEGVPGWLLEYKNGVVNSDSVRIKGLTVPPGYLMLTNKRAGDEATVRVAGREVTYLPFSFDLILHPRTWVTRYFNRGLRELKAVTIVTRQPVQLGQDIYGTEDDFQQDEDGGYSIAVKKKVTKQVRCKAYNDDDVLEDADEPQFLDKDGRQPRDPDGSIKSPLDPKDIIVVEKWTKKRLPFSKLPLT